MRWKDTEYSGWGRVLKAKGKLARPERLRDLDALIAEGLVPAIGNLRSYGDAALNDSGKAIVMTRLDRLLAFEPATGVLEAEAGVTIDTIMQAFVPKGWMPAVVPGTAFATLGGCIANDVHGKNHHLAGTFGASVIELTLTGADGRTRSISAKRDASLFRATLGGLGQTGIIRSVSLQLVPCNAGMMEVHEERIANLSDFIGAFDSSAAGWTVGWIDATATGDTLGRGIFEEGALHQGTERPAGQPRARSIPFNAPGLAMSPPVVRWFNRVRLGRVPVRGRNRVRTISDFSFPLDQIHNWNRLYGKQGFHQFQCVIPSGTAAATLRPMLNRIAVSGLASPIAVLKKLGPGRAGMLSFPMEGYTLAVDFPNRDKSRTLIAELESLTLDAGGRIYFAKDSLSEAQSALTMYPELLDWREIVNAADPDGRFETSLTRRLNLRGRQ